MASAAEQMEVGDMIGAAFNASKDMGSLKVAADPSAGEADATKIVYAIIEKSP